MEKEVFFCSVVFVDVPVQTQLEELSKREDLNI